MNVIDQLNSIRSQILGEGALIPTPYGTRRMTYVDHAASGRLFKPIEQFLCQNVSPTYANTHTETTFTGAQTTAFREESRQILKQACGCNEQDVLIFTGNGATGAIHTLIGCMGLAVPCCLKDRLAESGADLSEVIPPDERPVVFIGSYEHHSNEVSWSECEVDVEVVAECNAGGVDLDDLDRLLTFYAARRVKIGSFSAASNVTGRITDTRAVARVLHHHGALAFFDYAAAGPYVDVEMNPPDDPLAYKDAVFLSAHKFVGGPGAPGVLLAKKHLFENRVPAVPGGGTVEYVSPSKHSYLKDIQHREEGGTPNILGSIKAGLAMKLRESVGAPNVLAHEMHFAAAAIGAWRQMPEVHVLGNLEEPRLGIVSFVVKHEAIVGGSRSVVGPDGQVYTTACATQRVTKCLHHNFVVALLNDLFGIQARGGNSCAAPYSHRLLGVSGKDEDALEAMVERGYHAAKPGWTRVSFGWYDSEDTLAFVIAAVAFVAAHGWRFLNDYTFNPKSGTWKHRSGFQPPMLSLSSPVQQVEALPESVRWGYLVEAERLAMVPRVPVQVDGEFDAAARECGFERWFWLPGEV